MSSGARCAGDLLVLRIRPLAVMAAAMWDEVIGLMNDLIHSSAESPY
ncbi:hypothetical protein KR52_11265 [Synechococcus sp. KORDI-52]|nr:hypothetical protein [Synechococcus sp. KORDI-52]AII49714.1 hypothetical protein KR52_11265 [Synechococcus sp. KORDI-52]